MLFVGGSDQQSKHSSGPYQFRSLPIDYSVTSAYKGSAATTPLSITDHRTSPIYLQRATSHKNPPRPSFQPEKTTPSPGNRPRTHSTSSYGANGRRPVPAPRTSICSQRSETSDYQTIDNSMPDVQVKEGMSPGNYAFGQSFLYPEILDPVPKDNAFSRASTLPISAQRPSLDSESTKQRSRSPDELTPRPQRNQNMVDTGSQYDTGSNSVSLASSLEFKSSRNSKRGASAQLVRRFNSRTSLTDVEKAERRKSDLLESSPYPQLYNLAMDDEDIKTSPSISPKTNHKICTSSTGISETPKKSNIIDEPPVPINTTSTTTVSASADPIYSQIRKVPAGAGVSSNVVTNSGEGKCSELNPPTVSSSHGVRSGQDNMTVSGSSLGYDVKNFSRDISGGLVYTPANPLHATGSGAGGRSASPIYERIGDLSDGNSLPPPQHNINNWQQGIQHPYNSFSRQRGTT